MLPEFRLPKSMSVHRVVACGSLKTPTLTVLVVMPPPRCLWAGTFCWAISGIRLLFIVACVSRSLWRIAY